MSITPGPTRTTPRPLCPTNPFPPPPPPPRPPNPNPKTPRPPPQLRNHPTPTPLGSRGRSNRTCECTPSTVSPRHDSKSMNTDPAAHACGLHATGYGVGPFPACRGNPQYSSGSRCRSEYDAAPKHARNTRSAASLNPYLANPAAIIPLSCGQIDPLWYDIGLYRASPEAIVLTPHPENMSGASSESRTRTARPSS